MLKLKWWHLFSIGAAFLGLLIFLFETNTPIPLEVYLMIFLLILILSIIKFGGTLFSKVIQESKVRQYWEFAKKEWEEQEKTQLADDFIRMKSAYISKEKFYAFTAQELNTSKFCNIIVKASPMEIVDIKALPTKFNPSILTDPFADFEDTFAVTSISTSEPVLKYSGSRYFEGPIRRETPHPGANIYVGSPAPDNQSLIEKKLKGEKR